MSEKKLNRAVSALMLTSLLLSGCSAGASEHTVATFSREETAAPSIYPTSSTVADPTVPATQAPVETEPKDALARELLDEILWPEASTREQVFAIYAWARTHISYGGHSDRADWQQTAHTVIRDLRGDCFGYFAATKLLFEELGIPNIDVEKVKNSETDSAHFWSLVSIDGGETYYHFDATPRMGEGDDFCLVTDEFLDAYSKAHKNCHNRDISLYPATPKEALP